MAKQPEVGNVAPSVARSDAFASVNPTNPMTFVAFYRGEVMDGKISTSAANVLRPKPKVKVPASRACPDADKSVNGTPMCNWEGWSYDEAINKTPPNECQGERHDGRLCGKNVVLKNEAQRYLQFSEYQFVAKNPQQAAFLASKFPRDSEMADDYAAMNYNGAQNGLTYPFKGRTWRQALDQEVLPNAKRANPNVKVYGKVIASEEKGEVIEIDRPVPRRA
jgi:hypothetical protein